MNVQIVKEYPSPFGSDNVALMRGYSKPSSTSAISSSDSLNTAIGKLEKSVDDIPGITISTTDLTPGTSPLTTGDLYFVYEA